MNRAPDAELMGVPVYVDKHLRPMDCWNMAPNPKYWGDMIVVGARSFLVLTENTAGLVEYDREVLIQRDYD